MKRTTGGLGTASATEAMTRRHVLVHGQVQGVGFRYSAREAAWRLDLLGWIRNRTDGRRVEIVVEGDDTSVATFLRWCPHYEISSFKRSGNWPGSARLELVSKTQSRQLPAVDHRERTLCSENVRCSQSVMAVMLQVETILGAQSGSSHAVE